MARKRATRPGATGKGVSAERAARLHHLLQLLSAGPKTRSDLTGRLQLDVRGFYRDLELLRNAGIELPLERGRYSLQENLNDAIARLPFPDPHLTLGEANQLAKGRTTAHRRLREQIALIFRDEEKGKKPKGKGKRGKAG